MPVLMFRNMDLFVDDWNKPSDKHRKHHRFMTRITFNIEDKLDYITRKTDDIIYTSPFNKRYLVQYLHINEKKIVEIPYNETIYISDEVKWNEIKVTSLDANYYIGSTMFLFQGAFGNHLYTGFFRLNKRVLELPLLRELVTSKKLNTVYFDNTYAAAHCEFPKREEIIRSLITEVKSKPKHHIIIEASKLGKEEVFCELANNLKEKIYVSKERYGILQSLGYKKYFTTNKKAARISVWDDKVTPKNFISLQATKGPHMLFQLTSYYVGVDEDTMNSLMKIPEAKILPYSNHCSHSELMEFLTQLTPCRIEPIVKVGSGSHAFKNSIVPTCMIQCCYTGERDFHNCSFENSELYEKPRSPEIVTTDSQNEEMQEDSSQSYATCLTPGSFAENAFSSDANLNTETSQHSFANETNLEPMNFFRDEVQKIPVKSDPIIQVIAYKEDTGSLSNTNDSNETPQCNSESKNFNDNSLSRHENTHEYVISNKDTDHTSFSTNENRIDKDITDEHHAVNNDNDRNKEQCSASPEKIVCSAFEVVENKTDAGDYKLNSVIAFTNEGVESNSIEESDELVYFTENVDQLTNTAISEQGTSQLTEKIVQDFSKDNLNFEAVISNGGVVIGLTEESDELLYFTENDESMNSTAPKICEVQSEVTMEHDEENLSDSIAAIIRNENMDFNGTEEGDEELMYFTEDTNFSVHVTRTKRSEATICGSPKTIEKDATVNTTEAPSCELLVSSQNVGDSDTDSDCADDEHDADAVMMSVVSKIKKKCDQIDERIQSRNDILDVRILANNNQAKESAEINEIKESLVALWKAFVSIWECSLVKVEQKVEPIKTDDICTCQKAAKTCKNTLNINDHDSDGEILYLTEDEDSNKISIPLKKIIGPVEIIGKNEYVGKLDESDDELYYLERDFSPTQLKDFATQFSMLHSKLKKLRSSVRKISKMYPKKRKLDGDSFSDSTSAKSAKPLKDDETHINISDTLKCSATSKGICSRKYDCSEVEKTSQCELPKKENRTSDHLKENSVDNNVEYEFVNEFEESDNNPESLVATTKSDHRALGVNARMNLLQELNTDVDGMYNECLVIITKLITFLVSVC